MAENNFVNIPLNNERIGDKLRYYLQYNLNECKNKKQPNNEVNYQPPDPMDYTKIREYIKDANPVIPFNTTKELTTHPFPGTIRFQRVYEFFHALFKRYKLPRYTTGLPFDEYMPQNNTKTPLREFKEQFDYKICNVYQYLLTSNYLNSIEYLLNKTMTGFMIFKYVLPLALNITDNGQPFLTDEHTRDFINLFLTFEGRIGSTKLPIKVSNNNNTPYRLAQDWDADRFTGGTFNTSYEEYLLNADRWNYRYFIDEDEFLSLSPTESNESTPHNITDINIVITNKGLSDEIGSMSSNVFNVSNILYILTNSSVFTTINPTIIVKGELAFKYNFLRVLFTMNNVTNIHPQLMFLLNKAYLEARRARSTDPKQLYWGNSQLHLTQLYGDQATYDKLYMVFAYFVNKLAKADPTFIAKPLNEKLNAILAPGFIESALRDNAELSMYLQWAAGAPDPAFLRPETLRTLFRRAEKNSNTLNSRLRKNLKRYKNELTPIEFTRPSPAKWADIKQLINVDPSPGANANANVPQHPLGPIIKIQRVFEFLYSIFFRKQLPAFTSGLPFDEYMPAGNTKMSLKDFKTIFDFEVKRAISEKIANQTDKSFKVSPSYSIIVKYIYPLVFNIPDMNYDEYADLFNKFVGWNILDANRPKNAGGASRRLGLKISDSDNTLYSLTQPPDIDRLESQIGGKYNDILFDAEINTIRELAAFQNGQERLSMPLITGISTNKNLKNVNTVFVHKTYLNSSNNPTIPNPFGPSSKLNNTLYIIINKWTNSIIEYLPGYYYDKFNIIRLLFINKNILNIHPQLIFLMNKAYLEARAAKSTDPKQLYWSDSNLFLERLSGDQATYDKLYMVFAYFVNRLATEDPTFIAKPLNEKLDAILAPNFIQSVLADKSELEKYVTWTSIPGPKSAADPNAVFLRPENLRRLFELYRQRSSAAAGFHINTNLDNLRVPASNSVPATGALVPLLNAPGFRSNTNLGNVREPHASSIARTVAAKPLNAGAKFNPFANNNRFNPRSNRFNPFGTTQSQGFNTNLSHILEPYSSAPAPTPARAAPAPIPVPYTIPPLNPKKGIFGLGFLGLGGRRTHRMLKKRRSTRRKHQKK